MGFTSTAGKSYKGDHAKWKTANNILMNRSIEAAVFENGSDSILGEGLAYDGCHVGVITNVELWRHYGRARYRNRQAGFQYTSHSGGCGAAYGRGGTQRREPMLVEMAALCNGEIIYFSMDSELPVVIEHRIHGNRAVIVRDSRILPLPVPAKSY